ncbi:MAG: hypothetical protein AB1Z23_11205 [Eubacteriales bacterium]
MNRYNDVFHEEIVIRKNQGFSNFLYPFVNVFMYIFLFFALVGIQGLMQSVVDQSNLLSSVVFFFGFGGLAVASYFYKDTLKTDYEYSYTNGVLDIAKVRNNKKRKEMLSCNVKTDVEFFAPIMTNDFNRYQSMSEVKKMNAWLNRDIKKQFAIIKKDNQKIMLIFEPSEKMMQTIKKHNPQKVKTQ